MYAQNIQMPNIGNLGYSFNHNEAPLLNGYVNAIPGGIYGNDILGSINAVSASDLINYPRAFATNYLSGNGFGGFGLPVNTYLGLPTYNRASVTLPAIAGLLGGFNPVYNGLFNTPVTTALGGYTGDVTSSYPWNVLTSFGGSWPHTGGYLPYAGGNLMSTGFGSGVNGQWGKTVIPQGIWGISAISIVDNDTDLSYEFFVPGLTSANLDVSVVQNEIRVRMMHVKGTTTQDGKGTLICRLPVPNFVEISKITARVHTDGHVSITVPRGSEFTKLIKKVKVS